MGISGILTESAAFDWRSAIGSAASYDDIESTFRRIFLIAGGRATQAQKDEYKEKGTKAKAFKNWFGDWEAATKQHLIRETAPTEIQGDEFFKFADGPVNNMAEARAKALNYARENGIICEDAHNKYDTEGHKIIIAAKGIKNALGHGSGKAKIQIVAGLKGIIENAVPIDTHPNDKNPTLTDHIYAGQANIGGEKYVVGIVTHEDKNGDRFYDHELTTIEKLDGIPTKAGAAPKSGVGRPSRRASVIDYINDVFNVKSKNISKVVKIDGSPQDSYKINPIMVYHGTSIAGFDRFDTGKQDARSLFGPGFYFTEDKDIADSYQAKGQVRELDRPVDHKLYSKISRWRTTKEFSRLWQEDIGIRGELNQLLNAWNICQNSGDYRALDVFLASDEAALSRNKFKINRKVVSQGETKACFLNIKNPFNIDPDPERDDAPELDTKETDRLVEIAREMGFDGDLPNNDRPGHVYDTLCNFSKVVPGYTPGGADASYRRSMRKEEVTEVLRRAGYDGITHIGGVTVGNKEHRVWIAFEPNQIKSIDNEGGFTESDNIYESADDSKNETPAPSAAAIRTPVTVEENIQRGKDAMKRVIAQHVNEPKAMYRKDLGWIAFYWGKEGQTPPEFTNDKEMLKWWQGLKNKYGLFNGGYGVSHIIAKRDWEGKYIKEFSGQSGKDVALRLVSAIAKGRIAATPKQRVTIRFGLLDALLDRKYFDKEEVWLVSGLEIAGEYKLIYESAGESSLKVTAPTYAHQNFDYRNGVGASKPANHLWERAQSSQILSDSLSAVSDQSSSFAINLTPSDKNVKSILESSRISEKDVANAATSLGMEVFFDKKAFGYDRVRILDKGKSIGFEDNKAAFEYLLRKITDTLKHQSKAAIFERGPIPVVTDHRAAIQAAKSFDDIENVFAGVFGPVVVRKFISREISELEKRIREMQIKLARTTGEEEASAGVVKGEKTTAFLNDNSPIDLQYAVVEAKRLVTSHTDEMSLNQEFSQDLQPRDRGREGMKLQVDQMAEKLNPERLGESTSVSTGAPIIGQDLTVESGNGRTIAIRKAYAAGAKGQEYKQWLIDHAGDYGIPAIAVEEMEAPALVRIRLTKIDRAEFARKANEDEIAQMAPSELARADAAKLTDDDISLFQPSEDGNIAAASNRPFIARFFERMGQNAATGYMTKDGSYTKQLIDRVQAAIFQKAYQDDNLLALMSEEADPKIKNILGAMTIAAGEFSRAKAIDKDLMGIDIPRHVIEAAKLIKKSREDNQAIEEVLAQGGLFEDISEDTKQITLFIDKNIRSARRMGEVFKESARLLRKIMIDEKEPKLLDAGEPLPSAAQIVARAIEKEKEGREGASLFEAADVEGSRFIDLAISDKSNAGRYSLSRVTPDEAARIKKLIGIDVIGYRHEINSNDLRHSLKAHGNKEKEARRNPPQIAITVNDLKMIPKIIQDYDDILKGSTEGGRKSIIYKKKVNGFIYYAEVVLKNKGILSGKTMWKRPSGSADASSLTPGNTPISATSHGLKVSIGEIEKPVKPILENATRNQDNFIEDKAGLVNFPAGTVARDNQSDETFVIDGGVLAERESAAAYRIRGLTQGPKSYDSHWIYRRDNKELFEKMAKAEDPFDWKGAIGAATSYEDIEAVFKKLFPFTSGISAKKTVAPPIEELLKKPDVDVTVLVGNELSNKKNISAIREAARAHIKTLQGKPLRNNDTEWDLVIAKKDREKLVDDYDRTENELQALVGIEEIASKAILAETHPDVKNNPFVLAIHRMYSPVMIGEKLFRAKLTVKEYESGRNNLHAIETIEIENPAAYPSNLAGNIPPRSAQPAGFKVSIATLLKNARKNDGTLFIPGADNDENNDSARLTSPDFRGWRYVRIKGTSGGKIFPVQIGGEFSPEETATLVKWIKYSGMTVGAFGKRSIEVYSVPEDLNLYGAAGRREEEKKQRQEEDRIRRENRQKDSESRAYKRESSEWILDHFFGVLNNYNMGALADFLEGKTRKYKGIVNHKWIEPLTELGAIKVEGEDKMPDWDKIKAEYKLYKKEANR